MPMPAPLAVNREAVRTLAVAVGVREAARQMGIPEPTVQAWSRRGKWTAAITQAKAKAAPALALHPNASKPADALAKAMLQHKGETKIGLAKYSAAAATRAGKSRGDLRISRQVKDVADIMTKLWPEQTSRSGGLNLQLLTGQVAIQYNTGPASQD